MRCLGLGDFHRVVSDVHHRLSDFIHKVVVHRRDEAVRILTSGSGLIWFPLLLFFSVSLISRLVVLDPARIDEEFRKAWLPYFCRSGQREASLE